ATSTLREDTQQKGLLFAGTETQVYVSFDDGDHWQSLRLNMPPSSVRDLQVKDDDLVAGTHGRGYLVLDDITPLRQLANKTAVTDAMLYRPQTALRIRGDMNPPTPWVPEMPTGENPPDGAIIEYYLGANTAGPVTLEILDSSNNVVGRFASTDPVPQLPPYYDVPTFWARPPRILSAKGGHHRFLWDMRYPAVPGVATGPDADQAVPHNTPSTPTSPWVMTGSYSVRLTADGKTLNAPLVVRMDPRVKASTEDLQAQFDASKQLYDDALQASEALQQIQSLREQIKKSAPNGSELDKKLEALAGKAGGFRRGPAGPPTLTSARGTVIRLEHELQASDVAPTAQLLAASAASRKTMAELLGQWKALQAQDLKAVNVERRRMHLDALNPRLKSLAADNDEIGGGNKDENEQ
ncbi:MAG: glycoside hydrolase, partial [Acidobacteriaceae bacterium]